MHLDFFDLNLLAAGFSWTDFESWWAIAQMVLGLGFVIFVHELGHFLVAKACGVKCDKFYVGFDAFDIKIGNTVLIPRAILKKQWGETEYGIGILPLGGYVKMLGQDDNPANAEAERERSMVRKDEAEESDETAYELDPRSYQAKSVWQRMAIISAGVVMNLIFAVIFAATAYGLGVKYTTSTVGVVTPGGPAWEQNMRPGDRVVSVRADGEERKHLRFRDDVMSAIVHNGDKRELKLTVVPHGTDERRAVMVKPRVDLIKQKMTRIGVIGIKAGTLPVLPPANPTLPGSAAERASKGGNGFQPGDRIVAIDGVDIPDVATMRKHLARNWDRAVEFKVERAAQAVERAAQAEAGTQSTAGQTATFSVESNRMKLVGIEMEFGPLVAIQSDSPAESAGLQVGDQLLKINGESVGDPVTLSQRLRKFAAEESSIEVTVKRGDQEQTVTIQPRMPYTTNGFNIDFDQRIAVDELGISFVVENKVANVVKDSPADQEGVQPGDVLINVEFVAASEEKKIVEAEELGFVEATNSFDFAEAPGAWPAILQGAIQPRLDDTKIVLSLKRGDKTVKSTVLPEYSDDYNLDTRGIHMLPDEEVHTAESFSEALWLGFRQTKEDASKIYGLLGKLFQGEVSVINLGGPVSIAKAATNEALGGPSRILLFLTLLSANLAIVNFLPIPVLDGGHMVFLIYEAIFRRPVSEKLQIALSVMGLIFIVGLMLMVFSFDILRELV